MGLERVSITAKIDAENLLLIEGVRQNALPFPVSRSSALNLILTGVRALIADGEIAVSVLGAQTVLRNSRVEGVERNEGIPAVGPKKVEPETKAKAVGA